MTKQTASDRMIANMVGRRVTTAVKSTLLGGFELGTVEAWEPFGPGMCDTLVRRDDDGGRCWYASGPLVAADDLGPLPRRDEVREVRRLETLASLEAIRAQHVKNFGEPWPGAEHGKAIIGRALDGAIADLKGGRS